MNIKFKKRIKNVNLIVELPIQHKNNLRDSSLCGIKLIKVFNISIALAFGIGCVFCLDGYVISWGLD